MTREEFRHEHDHMGFTANTDDFGSTHQAGPEKEARFRSFLRYLFFYNCGLVYRLEFLPAQDDEPYSPDGVGERYAHRHAANAHEFPAPYIVRHRAHLMSS
jgi:hypothetical protein